MPMTVIRELCSGCGACVRACPYGAIKLRVKESHVKQERCRECEECLCVCPNGAITGVSPNRRELKNN